MTVCIKPRNGLVKQIPAAVPPVHLGELLYITDTDTLCVGDGKGGVTAVTQIVRGPDDGLYTKVDGVNGYIPLVIKL